VTESRNNKGAKCSSAGKKDIIKRLNKILGENPYFVEGDEKFEYNDENTEYILRPGLCVILEIVLRYFNESKKGVWFFDVEQAVANRVVAL
jgi:hypothetical protein